MLECDNISLLTKSKDWILNLEHLFSIKCWSSSVSQKSKANKSGRDIVYETFAESGSERTLVCLLFQIGAWHSISSSIRFQQETI